MLRILVPVDGSPNCRHALQHVVREFMSNTAMEVHLLNVQTPFSQHIARFVSGRSRREFHLAQAEAALDPARNLLNQFRVPYAVHVELGDRAKTITDLARRLRCDQIVMSTARKNSLTRLVESSVTNRVLQLTTVSVKILAGDDVSKFERYGIPAALGAALAVLLVAAD